MKVNEIFEESSLVCKLPIDNCPENINEIEKELRSLKDESEQDLRLLEFIKKCNV